MESTAINDAVLIELLRSGDRKAFDTLYYRYFSKLYSVVYKRVKSKEITEEIIQELFTTLWVKRADLNIDHTFTSYVFTAVKYMVFKYFRNEGVRKAYSEHLKINYAGLDNFTEDAIICNDLKARYEHALKKIPAKSGYVFNLSRYEHKTNKDISLLLNISEKAVEYHITKSLAILRLNLKDYLPLLFAFAIYYGWPMQDLLYDLF